LDPNDSGDDSSFRIKVEVEGGLASLSYPSLKPSGSFHLHTSDNLDELADPENRINTITSEMVEAMSEVERNTTVLEVECDGHCGFYMLIFEADEP